jgi:hypothetical protein
MSNYRFTFCASTGRTATMFLAATLNTLSRVVGLHEGYAPGDPPIPWLPLINLQNRKAWFDPAYAERTVSEMRDFAALSRAAGDADVLVDVAFYNAPLLVPLARKHPDSTLFVIFRRCETFVRSATIVSGEDLQPAGWPDRLKTLTDRERFISLGRLKPSPGSDDAEYWSSWSAIQRNIWLWHSVNSHLLRVTQSHANCHPLFYEDLAEDPKIFWTKFLHGLDLFSESNLVQCAERSTKKMNQRGSYQIGAIDTWGAAERSLYEQLALPLEKKLYE